MTDDERAIIDEVVALLKEIDEDRCRACMNYALAETALAAIARLKADAGEAPFHIRLQQYLAQVRSGKLDRVPAWHAGWDEAVVYAVTAVARALRGEPFGARTPVMDEPCGVLSNVFHLPCTRSKGHAEPDHRVTAPDGSTHQWVDYDLVGDDG